MNNRSVRNWLVALGLVSGLSLQSTAVAQSQTSASATNTDEKSDTVTLEKFEVTGSRIKRLDTETPAPVVAYDNSAIEAKGYTNIGDFIQSLPFNTGSANAVFQTSSFLRGAATANIRGLGSQRFLTLVDGRRPAPYALANSGNRSVFDFNSLPSAAIDKVEFLKDGASAIYGSDAITGVLNIKLKKNFSGLSVTGYYGNTTEHDQAVKQVSIVAGADSGKTRVTVAVDAKTANSSYLRDYGVTTTDYSTVGGTNFNSTSNYPANISLSGTATAALATQLGVTNSGFLVVNGGTPLTAPTAGNFVRRATAAEVGNENRFNFADIYQIFPSYDYTSAYASFEHEFNDNITAFGQVSFSDNFTYYAFTPAVIGFASEGLSLPANNPYNPFGIPLTTLTFRTNFGPVRKFDTESIAANFLGGLRGTVFNKWDWEVGAAHAFNRVTTVSRNAIRASTFQSALNGTLTGFTGVYFNPFGPSNPDLSKALFTTSTGTNRTAGTTFDASVSGSLFELPGGDLGIAAGSEFRNEDFITNPDTAAYLGSGGGQPLTGTRDVTSAYVELTAPVFKFLELQGAVRYEDYSDFGNTTKPKIAAKINLPKNRFVNAIIRGSYSESFQAPALGLLYASQTVGFTTALLDPLHPEEGAQQRRVVTGGNPALLPEEAESYYGGIVLEDIGGIKNLSFNIDYFKFRINQVIVTPTAAYILSDRGQVQFPTNVIRTGAGGNIVQINTVPSNNPAAYQLYRGFDLGVNYRLNNTRVGDFTFSAETTRILEIGSDNGLGAGYFDNVGLWNNIKWRGQASTSWRFKDYGASITADYYGSFFDDFYTGVRQSAKTLVSVGTSYRGFFGTTLSVGVNNLFDTRPPFNGFTTTGYDESTYPAFVTGRYVYFRIRKDF